MRDLTRVVETGLLELVGKDEEIASGEVGGSVSFSLTANGQPNKNGTGEILNVTLIATQEGTGAIQDSAGYLLVFDADPNPTAGDTDLAAAEWKTLIGIVTVEASDWITDANGGAAFIYDTPIAFHDCETLYFVWLHNDATSLNDGAGDDEVLEMNAFMRLE